MCETLRLALWGAGAWSMLGRRWGEMLLLCLVFDAIAAPADPDALERRLLTLMTPCANACANLTRYGRSQDGGYLMCQDVLKPPHGLTAAFSFGIKGRDSWGIAVSRELGLLVHEFDCYNTVAPKSVPGTNLRFTPTCIGPSETFRSGRQYATVEALVAARVIVSPAAQTGRGGHLLMKMDVEVTAWESLHTTARDQVMLPSAPTPAAHAHVAGRGVGHFCSDAAKHARRLPSDYL